MKNFLQLLILSFLVSCNGGGGGGKSSPSTSDPLSPYMWHLLNTNQSFVNGATPLSGQNINLGDIHRSATGTDVKVVVSDGRIDLDHPELADNSNGSLSKNYTLASPFLGDPTSTNDSDNHGTSVAGLILAKKDNGTGGYGVAPEATLIGYNFLDSDQSISKAYDQILVDGNNAIFNYSYGYPNCMVQAGNGFTYAMLLRAGSVGENNVYVTAAGNDFLGKKDSCGGSASLTYYGNANYDQDKTYPYTIVVGATNSQGVSANYSTPGSNVWISAPGGDDEMGLIVADLVGCNKGKSPTSSLSFDKVNSSLNPDCAFNSEGKGTSFAAPIVSGAVAILREVNPSLKWRDIKHILATTATKIHPTASSTTHPAGNNLTGHTYQQGWVTNAAEYPFHPWYGFGQVDLTAAKALAEAPDFDLKELKSTDAMSDAFGYSSGIVNLSIPDNSSTGVSSMINVSAHHLFVEHVQVRVNISHTWPSDLGIELTSPLGTTTKLMNINSKMLGTNLTNVLFGANAFYGERSRGNWIIKIIDGENLVSGTLVNWSISIVGNKGAALADTTAPLAPTEFSKSGSNLTWTASASGDVARYEICIAPTSLIANGCTDTDWRHVRSTTTMALSNFIYRGLSAPFVSGTNYSARIRTVDTSENESNYMSTTWTQP